MEDIVNFPKHYRQSKTETIDLIKESMTTEEFYEEYEEFLRKPFNEQLEELTG